MKGKLSRAPRIAESENAFSDDSVGLQLQLPTPGKHLHFDIDLIYS